MSDRTDAIARELLGLKNDNGVINPTGVVEWARTHKKSSLHAALDWDDTSAAEKYRVSQVRMLIAVHIVDADGGRRFVSLSIDRKHDGSNGYRAMDDIVARPDLREIMLKDALADLERVQGRYQKLTELGPVWEQAEKVRETRTRKRAA